MRRRLLLVTLAVTSLLVVAFAVPLGLLVRDVARDRAVTDAERDLASLVPVLAVSPDAELLEEAIERTDAGADGRLGAWLPDGTQLGDMRAAPEEDLALARDRRVAFSRAHGGAVAVYTPVVVEGGGVVVLRVHVPKSLLREGVASSWAVLAALAVGLLTVAVIVTDRLARSVTRPAVDLAATSRALAGGDMTARAQVGGPPEIAEVGAAFNLLADRIGELVSTERERVADLSHRLRTPLTALRMGAEASGSEALAADVDRLEAAISDVIRAARRPLHDSVQVVCDLAAVAQDRTTFWGALADDDGRRWTCTVVLPGPHQVRLDPDEAGAAIDAVLGNVFAHTPESTPYAVSVSRLDDRVVLAVDDGGPGLDAHRTLGRGESPAGSTGLGLDIARRSAESGGGSLRIERSSMGGARVVFDLPATADAT